MKHLNEQQLREFSLRLTQQLEREGLSTASPTHLCRLFNERFPELRVTPQTFRKWLLAEAYPRQVRLLSLAEWLHVSAQWLRFGVGDRGPQYTGNNQHQNVVVLGAADNRLLPLITQLATLPDADLQIVASVVQGLADRQITK